MTVGPCRKLKENISLAVALQNKSHVALSSSMFVKPKGKTYQGNELLLISKI